MTSVICDNCGAAIGQLKEAHAWLDHPVCTTCHSRLKAKDFASARKWFCIAIASSVVAVLLAGAVLYFMLIARGIRGPYVTETAANIPATFDSAVVTRFGNHYYQVFDELVSWHIAKQKCESLGSHLACITSAAEDDFIRGFSKNQDVWLGGTDEVKEGEWRWVTGEPFTYTHWASPAPDNSQGVQHHAYYWNGRGWDDEAAGHRIKYICEWDQ